MALKMKTEPAKEIAYFRGGTEHGHKHSVPVGLQEMTFLNKLFNRYELYKKTTLIHKTWPIYVWVSEMPLTSFPKKDQNAEV